MSFSERDSPNGQSHEQSSASKRLRIGQEDSSYLATDSKMSGDEDDPVRKTAPRLERNGVDEHRQEASPVVHVRSIHRSVIEVDLWNSLAKWGKINNIFMMTQKHQALVEFEKLESAQSLVDDSHKRVVTIRQYPALFNYSKSRRIELPIRQNETDGRDGDAAKIHNILLFTIRKPMYAITVDVMHTVTKSFGKVLRIVIFRKQVLQSMVEFESVEDAVQAKRELNGQDIYSGCCTLKVEYAKQTTLNVSKNDSETWDFTVTETESRSSRPLLARPGAGPPRLFNEETDDRQPLGDFAAGGGLLPGGLLPRERGQDSYGYDRGSKDTRGFGSGYGYASDYDALPGGSRQGPQPSAVVIFHGLCPTNLNCDKLFNLLCLYGNVSRIKFLKTKEGVALVQMGDAAACDRVISNLHGAFIYGSRIQVSFSKQAFLQDQNNPGDLTDGTCAFKDYAGNKNNRFMTTAQASKNRILPPCEILHYYNAPPGITQEEIVQILEDQGCTPPQSCKVFTPKETTRSTSGLLHFRDRKESTDAICACNHIFVLVPDKPEKEDGKPNGHILKLCFSTSL